MTDQITEPEVTQPKKTGIAHRLYTGEVSYDFIGHRRLWYTVSAVVLVIAMRSTR